jgi:hypothetical protein
MNRNTSKRGCWTCKGNYQNLVLFRENCDDNELGRKIRCDKVFPTCQNCVRAGNVCGGYGFRLSWGHAGDRRRHAVASESRNSMTTPKRSLTFVNTRYRDTAVFYKYYDDGNYGEHAQNLM